MVTILRLKLIRIILTLILLGFSLNNYAWNAFGHRLVAQIAYNHLTPEAKHMCERYIQAQNESSELSFIEASVWLDMIKLNDIHWYDSLHYIDIPYSKDRTKSIAIPASNALWGIRQAISILTSQKASDSDKQLSLKVLIHLVGDVHQPLHTITRVSRRLPKGDMGGNLFPLAKNSIGANLHQYWDNGGGLLLGQSKLSRIRNKANMWREEGMCDLANMHVKPKLWIKGSHRLAKMHVYHLKPNTVPGKIYQKNTQAIVRKQIVFAGCRLAYLLNEIASR